MCPMRLVAAPCPGRSGEWIPEGSGWRSARMPGVLILISHLPCVHPHPITAHLPSQLHVESHESRPGWAVGTSGDHVSRRPNWLVFLLPLECKYMLMNINRDRLVLGRMQGSNNKRGSRTGERAADSHIALGCHTDPRADGGQGHTWYTGVCGQLGSDQPTWHLCLPCGLLNPVPSSVPPYPSLPRIPQHQRAERCRLPDVCQAVLESPQAGPWC